MELLVQRKPSDTLCTLGELFVNGVRECWTLEPPIREISGSPVSSWKVQGDTAVPQGRYRVIITFSPHFNRDMPELLAVSGFSNVRIHWGNKVADTEACLLVGDGESPDEILQSVKAFDELYPLIESTIQDSEEIWIEYKNPQGPIHV